MPTNENKTRNILLALLVILLLVWGYLHFSARRSPSSTTSSTPDLLKAEVVRADEGMTTIPPGFPPDIPVGPVITQSYRVYYPKNHATQYTVSYVMSGKMSDVIAKYLTYFKQNSYVAASSTNNYAVGTQGNHTLSVAIGPYVGKDGLLVTVNLLVH